MQCPKCKAKIGAYSKFCPMCGMSLMISDSQDESTISAADPPVQPMDRAGEAPAEAFYQYDYSPQAPVQQQAPAQQPVQQQFQQPVQQPAQNYAPGMPNAVYPAYGYNVQPAPYGQQMQMTAVKKKSKLPVIIAVVVAVVVLAIGGFAALLVFNTIGNGSSKVVDAFTASINHQGDLSYLKPYLFDEDQYMADSYTFSAITDEFDSGMVNSRITSIKTISGGVNFETYRDAVVERFPSVLTVTAITERCIITAELTDSIDPGSTVKTYYFDLAKVNGEWKIAALTEDGSSLYAF